MINIEVTNKITGAKKIVEVSADRAWEALTHFRSSVSTARFVPTK